MRVMTWNLWWRFGPWEQRQAAISATVVEQAPDVLLLQEVWRQPADGTSAAHVIADALGGWHVALTDDPFEGRDVGFHNAIVSRWPIVRDRSHPLPNGAGEEGHRRILVAHLATPWGEWPVVTTHLAYRFDESALRQVQARRLLEVVAEVRGDPETDLPPIVGGDLNAIPDSDEIRMLTGRSAAPVPGLVLSDTWEHVGDGLGPTWRSDNPYQVHTAWPSRRLDYVFVAWPRPEAGGQPGPGMARRHRGSRDTHRHGRAQRSRCRRRRSPRAGPRRPLMKPLLERVGPGVAPPAGRSARAPP